MPFKNNNLASGLGTTGKFIQGRSDIDPNQNLELGVSLPWASEPAGSYLYYDCAIGVILDSGIVVHNQLPQINNTPDTLASVQLDSFDLDKIRNRGVNLKSNDKFVDIVQRMAHSRYWFRLWGQAIRLGYQIPIPCIKTIGGIPAIPHDNNPQWAVNSICPSSNYGGIPLWRAQWSLWYTVAVPPNTNNIPVADPSAHITGNTNLVNSVQVPFSESDDNANTTGPAFAVLGNIRQ